MITKIHLNVSTVRVLNTAELTHVAGAGTDLQCATPVRDSIVCASNAAYTCGNAGPGGNATGGTATRTKPSRPV